MFFVCFCLFVCLFLFFFLLNLKLQMKSKKSRREKKPWINDEIITLARGKKRLYSKSRKWPDKFKIWEKYKKCRNKLKSLTKREYHSYVTDIANGSSDHGKKKIWSFVRASKAKPTASSFKINDISVTEPMSLQILSMTFFFHQIIPFLMSMI